MANRTVIVASSVGLHARPASLFVRAVAATGLQVTIAKEGFEPVDARSILSVMSLGVQQGQSVLLTAEGEDAEGALNGLVALLSRDLDKE